MEKNKFLKPQDAWITVIFFDVFAIPIAKFTSRYVRQLTPDHFSFGSLYTFVLALIVLYFGYPVIALILMLLSTTLDCVDGKLARLNEIQTVHGKYLDALCDFLAHSFGFLAIAVWFYMKDDYLSVVIILIWSGYLGIMHINSVLKPVSNNKSDNNLNSDMNKWNEFCASRRLISRPISVVEIAFVVIPFSVVIPDFSSLFLSFFTFLFFMNRIFIKVG
ncbi:CDP-alcohol phosphatidyltransferase family protein [Colwellia sp. BRX8-2]|uniref:CDP-alcohol phosphatidyltransferase family protein n=1 Tax=unclassified Colwellia TaxID=196834 RepID=UPI0015F4F2BF|nr:MULTISPECIES: CDP-alcohol phosphatidyltransferase family protein [unclassified Colwellia]MBA6362077.1 CDP-alcohol phosphatidyltransferase family protein [Colwellia sp. BRX8-6]MBA6369679.1 CDP-alcohol phosphatidyltransferase family protein [Colwellia sp. BRX8-5]MBA6377419.1 CDP-alcohol phosphatidyltransferase family protein [Colwellia sp. BRX8-2]